MSAPAAPDGGPLPALTRLLQRLLSDEGLTKKASLNALATTIDYVARWLVTFLVTPLLVSVLGDFTYGVWQVLGRLIGYLSPATGRPEQALKWTIATQQGSNDHAEKRRQVGSALVVWVIFLPLLTLLGAVIAWNAPGWLKAPPALASSVRWAAAVLVADLILSNLAEIPRSVLRGENLGYKRMGLSTLLVLLGGVLTAVAAFAHGGLIGVAGANLVTTTFTGVMFIKVALSNVVWFGVAKPLSGAVRRFLGLSFWFLAWTLVMQLLRGGDVVVLGVLGSAEMVTRYSLTRYIPETLVGFVAILMFGVSPGLGRIVGSRDLAKAVRVRGELMTITWLLVTTLSGTMLLWNRSFIRLWIHRTDVYAGDVPNLLIILATAQFVFIRNDANIIDLTLDLRKKVLLGLLSAGLSAATAGVLVARYGMGITGLALGYLVGQSLLTLMYPVIVGRFLGLSTGSQVKGVLRPAAVTAALWGVLSALESVVGVRSWPLLVMSAGLTLVSCFLISFYSGIAAEERARLLKRLRRATPAL